MNIWIRVGDAGDYNDVGDVYGAVDDLNSREVGEITGWIEGGMGVGFETENYYGLDFISCFWGDERISLVRRLDTDERAYIENNLKNVLN